MKKYLFVPAWLIVVALLFAASCGKGKETPEGLVVRESIERVVHVNYDEAPMEALTRHYYDKDSSCSSLTPAMWECLNN